MKPSLIIKVLFFLFLISNSLGVVAQTAVLYNFDFFVPDAYRHEIQEYDNKGKKKLRPAVPGDSEYSPGREMQVLNKYLEPVSTEEARSICELAAGMLMRKYGYTEVTMMYPTGGGSQSGKISGFPNRNFKRAAKKNSVDAYITMEFKIENRTFAPQRSLHYEENGTERTMFMNITFSYTIFNAKEGVIDQKEISLKEELDDLFSENYNSEIVEKGYKLRKLYLTKEELFDIYKIAEKKIETME